MADPDGAGERAVWPVEVAWRVLARALFPGGVPPTWHERAACADDPEPVDGGHWRIEQARRLCGGCPVRRECLADAIAWETRSATRAATTVGTRGGLTATERAALYRALPGGVGVSGMERRRPRR
ncbi:WhiB family transcriptional regulator [Saccharopolyspora sp. 6M]|uniref:WhiB family transcriptional regulator n=1 Tax=Saccharopolyspora sp. 6M TaxID=2877237 RepID=UPI001CD445BF|nr:WhiB family transcriptional regulator [Saccharopolyspora sp. 6M]MCA1229947.1 WhiB family transcriptional regulator [Saccharopolyspora sp. 6M]